MNKRTKAESEILAGKPVDATVYIWYPCQKFRIGHSSVYIGGVPQFPWPDFRSLENLPTPAHDTSLPPDTPLRLSSNEAGTSAFSAAPSEVRTLSTLPNNRIRPKDDNYVSFLADSSIFRGNLSFAGVFSHLYNDFVQSPHLEYYLLDLDVPEMQRKKNEMYNGKMYGNLRFAPTYNGIYKNCSTMVARILKAGGVENLLNLVQRIGYAKNIYWTPKDIAQLCNELRNNDKAVKIKSTDCPDKLESSFKTLIGLR
ncbi:hypothetical protein ID853_10545 [Xenorhabdus sp. Vera]|uniref:hypothetical protein n=1 Tax=Xenorhabdus koppenhoeferi TaxID=351659 RepID=UPI0019B17161|nr:hypothetical protein [Xenorhabdus sp. Vera]MBD2811309.1 hypothetical protein [Xenorhabdus sp. Vera]